jgi:hypothetical protein
MNNGADNSTPATSLLPVPEPEPTPTKRRGGGQPGNSNALKDGRWRRRRLLKELAWRTQLDRRSALYLELRDREERLASGVGGRDLLSPQKQALLPTAAMIWLELDTLNHYISQSGSNLIDKRKRALRPIVHDRNRQVMTLKALLETIGLERLPNPVESLEEYLKRRSPHRVEKTGSARKEADIGESET